MKNRTDNMQDNIIARSIKQPLGWLKLGAAGLLITIIGSMIAGVVYQTVNTALDARRYPPPGMLVDIGDYRMHFYCTGERQAAIPAVILDASYPATVSSWVWIQPQISTVTRVCAYDRAGAGRSDLSTEIPSMAQMAEELHMLLENAGEPGPYVLVGHSWGGGITRLFAKEHPELVSGLVWIESIHPDAWARRGLPESTLGGLPPEQIAGIPFVSRLGLFRLFPNLRGTWGTAPGLPAQQQGELTAYFNTNKWVDQVIAVDKALPESLEQLRQAGSLGDIPLAIVIGGASEEGTGLGLELQRELAELSSNSTIYRIEGADHSSLVHQQSYALQTSKVILNQLETIQPSMKK